MRLAIIDLGTNSVRFDVYELTKEAEALQLHREKIMVRLGEGVFTKGRLDPTAVRRTLYAFDRFRKISRDFGVSKVVAFGTSALRDAKDSGKFLQMVRQKTGISVRVISGLEEAKLIALGILAHIEPPQGTYALVDIGGGSCEISVCRGHKILKSHSFPLGTARLQQVFLKQSPPDVRSLAAMRGYISTALWEKIQKEKWPKAQHVIGSSGTIRAVAKMVKPKRGSPWMERKNVRTLVQKMSRMGERELMRIPGMEPKRVDMILAGATLFEECLTALQAKKARSTDFSLRDGIFEEAYQLYLGDNKSHLAFHLRDLMATAQRFGIDPASTRYSVRLADLLFDKLHRSIGLKPQWRIYLIAATILRNIGRIVAPVSYGPHSYYIIKNVDFPATEPWEQEFVAQLCQHAQANDLPKIKLLGKGDKKRKLAFQKLLGILSIVDAVDGGQHTLSPRVQVKMMGRAIQLTLSKAQSFGLEATNLNAREKLQLKSLRRTVSVKLV